MIPKVFCINLDRSSDRWKYMESQFVRHGLAFERISAIEGASLVDRLDEVAVTKRVEEWKMLLTPNAIGCALSHVEAYRRFLDSGAPAAIFMEDDIEIGDDFAAVAASAAAHLPAGSCALLYFHGEEKLFVERGAVPLAASRKLHQAQSPWGAYTAGAYILDREGARRLATFNAPVYTTADSWGVFCRELALSGLYAALPPVTQPAAFSSDIGYSTKSRAGRWLERNLPGFLAKALRQLRANRVALRYRLVQEALIPPGPPEREG